MKIGLELLRIGIGIAMLALHGSAVGELTDFWGAHGWISAAAAEAETASLWAWSPLLHHGAAWQVGAIWAGSMLAAFALAIGWHATIAKWIVLLGHLAFVQRNPVVQYGVDAMLANLLVILCFAPVGRGLCVGRVQPADTRSESAWWGDACTWLAQLQMATCYFFAGTSKLRGDAWWHGYAVWLALANAEYTNVPLDWFARNVWAVNLLTYGTLLIEISYAFLVWGRARAWVIGAAMVQHAVIAVVMGLQLFSFVMIVGQLLFVRPEWFARGHAWLAEPRRRVPRPASEAAPTGGIG